MDNVNQILSRSSFHFDFLDLIAGKTAGNEKINACIQCGSCTGSCVAADGMSISPRKLWRSLQMGLEDDVLGSLDFWNCTTCGLCDKRCPRGIPMSRLMLDLREKYDKDGGVIAGVSHTLENLYKTGNITGDDPRNRFLWLDNLMLSEAEKERLFRRESKAVYLTGCVAALFPQVGGIPQSLTRLLLRQNADFSLLEDERCCGYPVMAGGKGLEDVREFAVRNISAIEAKGADTVIISCPTCHYMLTKIYPSLLGASFPFRVVHYTEYLVETGGLSCSGKEAIVTYHDPCDLGRKLHITEAPREILRNIPGVTLREMRFSGEEGKCCGGGGNLEMTNPSLSFDIATKRIGDALDTGAEYILSSCQQCKRTLQNAARKTRSRIKVMDLLEFLSERIEAAEREGRF